MSNMSNTPETDAFAIKFKTLCGEKYWVPVDIASKLERERDEAQEKAEQQRKEIVRLHGATSHAGGTPLKIALRERDEVRKEAEYYKERYEQLKSELDKLTTKINNE